MRNFVFSVFVVLVAVLTYCFLGRVDSPPEVVGVEVLDGYEYGYRVGHASFLRQMGMDVSLPPAVSYVSSHDGEYSQGYVDGYHRATEEFSCPRSCVY